MDEATIRMIGQQLVEWYAEHHRDLPWRRNPTPYRVWVSEVMLQQTAVSAVIPYYHRWMERFPDLRSLAQADEREVLTLWEGMGYYQRARRLHRTARKVMAEHHGRIPRRRSDLLDLPGVGPYIADAIRSLAFGEDVVALDANVARVFMRLLALEGRPTETPVRREVRRWAQAGMPEGRSAEYNQALMDFGSSICRPRRPECGRCFLQEDCLAFRRGEQYDIPPPTRRNLREITTSVAVFRRDGQVYLQKRPPEGLFGGMWEFPGGKVADGESPAEALVRECREELCVEVNPGERLLRLTHYYTVFKVDLHAFLCPAPGSLSMDETHIWVDINQLCSYPMPSANRAIADELCSRADEG